MRNHAGGNQARIYEHALEQNGYFTAVQAKHAGVTRQALYNLTARGSVERISFGLYRLVRFPDGPMDPYVEATLWPLSVRGVISHETALAIYGLSDVNPARIHMIVPRALRLRRDVPKRFNLHRVDLNGNDVNIYEGVPMTTPERTIRDCHAARLGSALIRQAIVDGRRTGHLRMHQARELERELLSN